MWIIYRKYVKINVAISCNKTCTTCNGTHDNTSTCAHTWTRTHTETGAGTGTYLND